MIELSDQDILSRLTNFEDAFVERKSTGDMRDLLKTAVGFANSMPVGYPAILFYGVTNEGEPEGKANLDSLQKTLSEKLSEAYPPIPYVPKVLRHKGKQFLAVIIPGSEDALQGEVHDGPHANALMDSLDATVFEDIGTPQWRSARWFLLESEMFFDYCVFTGIDGQRWRRHLRRVCRVVDHQKELAATQKEGGRR